ncbi:CaiB/BaiF CoA transferase family protein [Chloroflexota bacterium]
MSIDNIDNSNRNDAQMPRLPLEGIRVVELGRAWVGPSATKILGDLGAEVIKVESVNVWPVFSRGIRARPTKEMLASQSPFTGGYPNREPGKRPWNLFPLHVYLSRNKLGMTVRNLKEPKSRELFLRLIKVSDIFIENNQADTLDKLNVNYDVLKEVKPDIIVVRPSVGGLTGRYSDFRAHGQQLDALGGHVSLRGYTDMGPEANSAVYVTDHIGGQCGAFAAMLALAYRHKTGKGQLIDCSELETLPLCLSEAMMDYSMNQRVHTRIGNRDNHGAVPCGCYRCQGEDNWINITVTSEEEWRGFKKALENPSWAEEERFSVAYNRWQNQDALDKLIEEWTSKQYKYDVMKLLQKEGVPAGPVLNAADVYNDPHYQARGFFEKVAHPDAGTHLYPGATWQLSKTPIKILRPGIIFGEDNEYVYKHVLGVSDEEYAELVAQGEISDEPAPDIL